MGRLFGTDGVRGIANEKLNIEPVSYAHLDVYKRQASPYKFAASVLTALGENPAGGFAALDELHARTGVPVPKNLAAIRDLPVLHTDAVEKGDILAYVKEAIR